MTTSNPNLIPPAGGGDPDEDAAMNQGEDAAPDPLLADRLEGATYDTTDPDTPEGTGSGTDPDSDTDSAEADRRRTGAE